MPDSGKEEMCKYTLTKEVQTQHTISAFTKASAERKGCINRDLRNDSENVRKTALESETTDFRYTGPQGSRGNLKTVCRSYGNEGFAIQLTNRKPPRSTQRREYHREQERASRGVRVLFAYDGIKKDALRAVRYTSRRLLIAESQTQSNLLVPSEGVRELGCISFSDVLYILPESARSPQPAPVGDRQPGEVRCSPYFCGVATVAWEVDVKNGKEFATEHIRDT
ncbi:hypothetical protein B0H17DRAFT_1133924 [Mycena rosella]|uniref:Uncharacterized protein n=1 Tax=Mycena rosella TaxID=1033263 RepID=A0AAD7GJQ4_MYCRO|nr:hypothetical protein B0H17DRAFT_1133924 [Mycena rosella]